MVGPPNRVVVEVDQVILDGLEVTHHDVVRFRAELAAELGRLLGSTPLPADWRKPGRTHTYDRLATSVPALPTGGTELGRTTARAVHGGLHDTAHHSSPTDRPPKVSP